MFVLSHVSPTDCHYNLRIINFKEGRGIQNNKDLRNRDLETCASKTTNIRAIAIR